MVVETNFLFLNFLFFYLFIEVWFTYHKVHISSVYIAHWILRLNIPAPRPVRALPVSQSPSCPLSVINLSSFSPEYTLALLVKAQISLYLFFILNICGIIQFGLWLLSLNITFLDVAIVYSFFLLYGILLCEYIICPLYSRWVFG